MAASNEVEILIQARDQASKQLEATSKGLNLMRVVAVKAFLDIGKEALKAGKAVLDFALKGSELADRVGDMSAKLGVSTETLSTLGFAAEQTGSSIESMETGLRTLTRQVVMAATGSKRYADIFADLGVTVTDANGQIRPTMELLKGIADGMEHVTSETEKAGLMQMLFGSSGTDLIPIMEGGSAAMEVFASRARELGVVIETEAAAKADKFQDAIGQVKSATTGLSLAIGTTLLPALTPVLTMLSNLIGEMAKMVSGSEEVVEAGTAMANMLKNILHWGVGAYEITAKLVVVMMALAKARTFPEKALEILSEAKQSFSDISETAERLRKSLELQAEGAPERAEQMETETDWLKQQNEEMIRLSEANWAQQERIGEMAESSAEAHAREREEQAATLAATMARWEAVGQVTANTMEQMSTAVVKGEITIREGLKRVAAETVKVILKSHIDLQLKKLKAAMAEQMGEAAMKGPMGLVLVGIITAAFAVAKGAISAIHFQKGGLVTGGTPGRDSVPALLEPGELVLPRPVTEFMRKAFTGGAGGDVQEVMAGAGGGVTIGTIQIDNVSEMGYVDRLLDRINDAVLFSGRRLVASEVTP